MIQLVATTIPCKDCILFPTCKAQLEPEPTYTNLMMKLYPRCSLIQAHLKHPFEWPGSYEYSPTKVSSLVNFFTFGDDDEDDTM